MDQLTVVTSPVGELLLTSDGTALTGLWLGPHRGRPPVVPRDDGEDRPIDDVLVEARRQLSEYFTGERRDFDLPLGGPGTAFQREVWAVLRTIPYGQTWSYGELARLLGRPGAARAVGLANGRNPISIVVPCHRVIGAGGALTGYGGGVDNKRWLLDHERAVVGHRPLSAV